MCVCVLTFSDGVEGDALLCLHTYHLQSHQLSVYPLITFTTQAIYIKVKSNYALVSNSSISISDGFLLVMCESSSHADLLIPL